MRATIFGAVACVLMIACGPGTPESSTAATTGGGGLSAAPVLGETYRDTSGAFSIVFPVPFSVDTRRDSAGSSELVSTTASSVAKRDDRGTYFASRTVMSPAERYDCERGFASTRDRTLDRFSCKAIREGAIAGAKWNAREVEFHCTMSAMVGLMQVYCDTSAVATEKRAVLYELFVSTQSIAWDEKEARAFLSSFKPN